MNVPALGNECQLLSFVSAEHAFCCVAGQLLDENSWVRDWIVRFF